MILILSVAVDQNKAYYEIVTCHTAGCRLNLLLWLSVCPFILLSFGFLVLVDCPPISPYESI